jgi:hypothetical protein
VLRGTGDMRLPWATLMVAALVQIVVGGTLGLGLAGLPQFGMRGVAAGQLRPYVPFQVKATRPRCDAEGCPDRPGRASHKGASHGASY